MTDEAARQSRSETRSTSPSGNHNTGEGLHLRLPAEALEELVERVADRVRDQLAGSSPWFTRQAAADYLGVPTSRLEKDRTVPCHKWDGRVFYDRAELDEWLRER